MAKIQLVVTYDPQTSAISVTAPQDRLLAYGMLGMAREIIAARALPPTPAKPGPEIIVPKLMLGPRDG